MGPSVSRAPEAASAMRPLLVLMGVTLCAVGVALELKHTWPENGACAHFIGAVKSLVKSATGQSKGIYAYDDLYIQC